MTPSGVLVLNHSKNLYHAFYTSRLLRQRCSIRGVLQKISSLNIEISKYFPILPITILLAMFLLSALEAASKGYGFNECVFMALIDLRPTTVTIYAYFIYGCQVKLARSFKALKTTSSQCS